MTLFIDASAAVAMLALEDDAGAVFARLDQDELRLWSAVARWETTTALARIRKADVKTVSGDVLDWARRLKFKLVPIEAAEADIALQAFSAYGRSSGHPAKLNMGDCFAYACAKSNQAKLLYKGNDFSHTDLAWSADA